MNIQCAENILLLGAGFTKNFGGLLADEMWAEIIHHEKINAQPRIRRMMLNDFDYESIYHSVLRDDSFSDDAKNAMKEVIQSAYDYIDKILIHHLIPNDEPRWIKNVNELLIKFGNTSNNSFIFTLNQDLFIERFYLNPHNDPSHRNYNSRLSIPGIDKYPLWFMDRFCRSSEITVKTYEESEVLYKLKNDDYYTLPNKDEFSPKKANLLKEGSYFLIKLHGSYNWRSSDGTQAMVIGRGKSRQIKKEPLLEYYYEVFYNVLSQDQRRLLVIGYGFGDEHINRVISNAVTDHGLKIYILSPESPKQFKKKIHGGNHKPEDVMYIWEGIAGYFQCVEDVLKKDIYENQTVKEHFYNVFFGENNGI